MTGRQPGWRPYLPWIVFAVAMIGQATYIGVWAGDTTRRVTNAEDKFADIIARLNRIEDNQVQLWKLLVGRPP